MKKFLFIIVLLAFGLLIEGCKPAYVAVKPTYIEAPRPIRPSDRHIWVDGNWVWDSRARAYTRRDSYWAVPTRKRNYRQGEWRSTPRGYYWKPGRWR